MDSKIKQNLKSLHNLNKQRICWLRVSGFVVVFSLLVIIGWNYLINSNLMWAAISIGILITAIWWYWTMSIIRKLIAFKTAEADMLHDVITEIREIKQDIKNNFN